MFNLHKIKISEIFKSIQGEGYNSGIPSIFIRTTGCNLNCNFCDSKYSWKEGKEMSAYKIYDEVIKLSNDKIKHVVITGGEPLLWQKEIALLIKNLKELDYEVEIETNGTFKWESEILPTRFNISPKFQALNPEVIRYFVSEFDRNMIVFKFVISNKEDLNKVTEIDNKYIKPYNPITYLMPEGITTKELNKKAGWIIDYIKNTGYFRYSDRLQVRLFENKSGV